MTITEEEYNKLKLKYTWALYEFSDIRELTLSNVESILISDKPDLDGVLCEFKGKGLTNGV